MRRRRRGSSYRATIARGRKLAKTASGRRRVKKYASKLARMGKTRTARALRKVARKRTYGSRRRSWWKIW